MTASGAPSPGAVFLLRGVSKQFPGGGRPALADVDLEIRAGEQVAIVGPSGAGKSTLLGLLNGTVTPTTGEARILGHDLSRLSGRARRSVQRRIGTIYQQLHLVDNLRVIHNVNAGHLGRWPLARALVSLVWPLETETAAEALRRVGIGEKLHARTGWLSGGERQRVALARLLVQDPDAILADEPVSSLDPERSREVLDLLRVLGASEGKTLVASLHVIERARSHFGRLVGLRAGRIVFDLPAEQVTPEQIGELYRIEQGGLERDIAPTERHAPNAAT